MQASSDVSALDLSDYRVLTNARYTSEHSYGRMLLLRIIALSKAKLIARLRSNHLESSLILNSSAPSGLSTSLELYISADAKLAVLLLNSRWTPRSQKLFIDDTLSFLQAVKVTRVGLVVEFPRSKRYAESQYSDQIAIREWVTGAPMTLLAALEQTSGKTDDEMATVFRNMKVPALANYISRVRGRDAGAISLYSIVVFVDEDVPDASVPDCDTELTSFYERNLEANAQSCLSGPQKHACE